MVQWLRICISTAGFMGLIPQLGTEIPHAVQSKKLNIFLKRELEDKPQSGVKKIIFQVTKLTKDFLSREYQEHLRIRKHPCISMCKMFEHRIHCGR